MQKPQNNEPRPKFTGSYGKSVYLNIVIYTDTFCNTLKCILMHCPVSFYLAREISFLKLKSLYSLFKFCELDRPRDNLDCLALRYLLPLVAFLTPDATDSGRVNRCKLVTLVQTAFG